MSRFPILMYHMVSEPETSQEKRYACPPATLHKHMQFLRAQGYNIVSLDAIIDHFDREQALPEKTIAITLDDGFRDNYENALPIFKKFDIPATIFLATGVIEGTNHWMHENGYPKRDMLSWAQVKQMYDQGISIGAHTVNHVKLPELSAEQMLVELQESKRQIEDKLDITVKHFAYPYGLLNDTAIEMAAKVGFSSACSTLSGFNNLKTNRLSLRRLEVYGTDSVRALNQKITFGVNNAEMTYPLKYYFNRLLARLR